MKFLSLVLLAVLLAPITVKAQEDFFPGFNLQAKISFTWSPVEGRGGVIQFGGFVPLTPELTVAQLARQFTARKCIFDPAGTLGCHSGQGAIEPMRRFLEGATAASAKKADPQPQKMVGARLEFAQAGNKVTYCVTAVRYLSAEVGDFSRSIGAIKGLLGASPNSLVVYFCGVRGDTGRNVFSSRYALVTVKC